MNKQNNYIHVMILFIIFAAYSLILLYKQPNIFSYKFNTSLIDKYLCSQDITYEPKCKRLFLSDSDIHIAAGYLYMRGSDPTTYNFQHPPFIKYLYGYSILLFNNPYLAQIGLGLLFTLLTYILSFKVFKKITISLFTCLLLIVDPLFLSLSSNALLDLGQGVFLLLYILLMIFYDEKYMLQGIILSLLFGSKFWGGSLFFIITLALYLIYKRKFNLNRYLIHLSVAMVVFCLIYYKSFFDNNGSFNIILFELKTFKYWINHSVSSIFGSSLLLFLTGYLRSWWGNKFIIRADIWFFLWPIMFLISLEKVFVYLKQKLINAEFLINFIPVTYLFYLGIQAPFTRYFILILPFYYIVLANLIVKKIINKLASL